jgi:(p)ppGpp synthase/HD superfamily hydrolase
VLAGYRDRNNRRKDGYHVDDLRSMALHDITESLGEDGLRGRFAIEIAQLPPDDQDRLREALDWASELHRGDRRSREPYLNHLLRVTIRIAHHYRVTDTDVLCAALLHDAVEDHADDIAGPGPDPTAAALAVVTDRFGARVAGLVEAVTNPVYDPDRDAHEQYREHVLESLASDPWARVIKLSDFTDNAVGIHWSTPSKARRVAPKYQPLVEDLRQLLNRPDTPLDDDVKSAIDAQLTLGQQRLADVIDRPA